MKNKIIGWIIATILWVILFSYSILKSNVWRTIKCPTMAIDYEYEWVIKAEYKTLMLVDWIHRYVNWWTMYDWCYYDAWLKENKLICPDWYDSWAWVEDKWEFVLDMEEDLCYYVDDDISMLKAIYKEMHTE